MKKWIATYILFVSCLIFSLSGSASCGPKFTGRNKIPQASAYQSPVFQSSSVMSGKKSHQDRPDEFCRSLVNIHISCFSQLTPFIPAECPDLIAAVNTPQSVTVPATTVLNGYLLHLFPSHYFW